MGQAPSPLMGTSCIPFAIDEELVSLLGLVFSVPSSLGCLELWKVWLKAGDHSHTHIDLAYRRISSRVSFFYPCAHCIVTYYFVLIACLARLQDHWCTPLGR